MRADVVFSTLSPVTAQPLVAKLEKFERKLSICCGRGTKSTAIAPLPPTSITLFEYVLVSVSLSLSLSVRFCCRLCTHLLQLSATATYCIYARALSLSPLCFFVYLWVCVYTVAFVTFTA